MWKLNDQVVSKIQTKHTAKVVWTVTELPTEENHYYCTISLNGSPDQQMLVRELEDICQLQADWDGKIH